MLLLNACLTVKAHEAASHSSKGWEQFTEKVIDVVDKYGGANLSANGSALAGRGRGIVFMCWGAFAMKRVAKLDKVCQGPIVRCLSASIIFHYLFADRQRPVFVSRASRRKST